MTCQSLPQLITLSDKHNRDIMKIHPFLFASLVAATHCLASADERLIVDVAHDLDAARPSETIAIPWSAVNKALPGGAVTAHCRYR